MAFWWGEEILQVSFLFFNLATALGHNQSTQREYSSKSKSLKAAQFKAVVGGPAGPAMA